MAYIDGVAASVSGKKLTFTDPGKSASAEVSVSAVVNGNTYNLDSYLAPYVTKHNDGLKFGFRVSIPNNDTGKNLAQKLESVIFRIDSTYDLCEMGSNAVGYWLPKSEFGPIEAFKYDFSDILQAFTTTTTGQVRELIDGKWTGRFVEGDIRVPVPHTIDIVNGNAIITFDVRGLTFAQGQIIDFDPIAQTGSVLNYNVTTDNTGTASSTITVPNDATLVLCGVTGYSGTANFFSAGAMTFTKGAADTAMTAAVTGANGGDNSTSYFMAAMFYQVSPDTGANKALKWNWVGTGTATNVPILSLVFLSGINTSGAVRHALGNQSAVPPFTTGTLTAQSGDLIVAFVGIYAEVEGTANSWSNLTLLSQAAQYASADAAWATGSPTGNTTVALSSFTPTNDGAIVAIVLIPAAGGATQHATMPGTGSLSSAIKGKTALKASAVSGTGALAGNIKGKTHLGVSPAGAGALSADIKGKTHISATAAGIGAFTATSQGKTHISATMAGVGSFAGAFPVSAGKIYASITGTGSLTAAVQGKTHISSAIAGTGTFAGLVKGYTHLAATQAGVGSLSGTLQGKTHLASSWAGVGALSASIKGGTHLSASSWTGAGTLTGTSKGKTHLASSFAGIGTLVAAGSVLGINKLYSVMAGRGELTATLHSVSASDLFQMHDWPTMGVGLASRRRQIKIGR